MPSNRVSPITLTSLPDSIPQAHTALYEQAHKCACILRYAHQSLPEWLELDAVEIILGEVYTSVLKKWTPIKLAAASAHWEGHLPTVVDEYLQWYDKWPTDSPQKHMQTLRNLLDEHKDATCYIPFDDLEVAIQPDFEDIVLSYRRLTQQTPNPPSAPPWHKKPLQVTPKFECLARYCSEDEMDGSIPFWSEGKNPFEAPSTSEQHLTSLHELRAEVSLLKRIQTELEIAQDAKIQAHVDEAINNLQNTVLAQFNQRFRRLETSQKDILGRLSLLERQYDYFRGYTERVRDDTDMNEAAVDGLRRTTDKQCADLNALSTRVRKMSDVMYGSFFESFTTKHVDPKDLLKS
ncbi:hypothetical protein K474DRAFT_1712295 [Panus rudis PR-1116 ss-1]|nr:hypothetical protein K474DRAFT_1712295 [Panus rudis PR-1116 ss-1]